MEWYHINQIEKIDSPSIVLYETNLMDNLRTMLSMVNGVTDRLMPHVKTHKMAEVIKRMRQLGLHRFKVSTLAEAEMVAQEGAEEILIAHQLVGPKIERLINLIKLFPNTKFSTLVDNTSTSNELEEFAVQNDLTIDVFIDINNGMNRTGIEINDSLEMLIVLLSTSKYLNFKGLHVYDGHQRDPNFDTRKQYIEEDFERVSELFLKLKKTHPKLIMVCGGSPAFSAHLSTNNRVCSPGTCILWDWGYNEMLSEQDFKFAALLVSRVISKPTRGLVTIDLGHKSVGSENPIDKRVKFLNLTQYKLISQSEEHGILEVAEWENLKVGDVLYGVPFHICPTINLHDDVSVIKNNELIGHWEITARKRKLTI